MRASKKTFFLRNFWRIFRIFGEFSEFSANFQNFRRIFGEFSEFSANFWNFRRKKTKNSLVLRISRYTIWEVRYDILFDIRKSPISRHSINSRYDKLLTGYKASASAFQKKQLKEKMREQAKHPDLNYLIALCFTVL